MITEISFDITDKNILIVEDTLHTGATIDIAMGYLYKKNIRAIKVASLSYVANRIPDFFVLPKGNYCFPWSRDF